MNNKLKNWINLCDIYVILFVLHQYSDMYIHSSLFAIGTTLPMLFISLYFFYQAIAVRREGYIKALIVFIAFLSVYGIRHWMSGEYVGDTKPNSFFLGNWQSLTPILIFYISTQRGIVDKKRMFVYFIVFMFIAVLRYSHNYITHDLEVEENFANAGFTNNAAYYFVCMLPFVFLFEERPLIKYAVLLVCVYFVMNGMKRGAIFTTGLFLAFFLLVSARRDPTTSKRNRWKRGLSFVFLVIAIIAVSYFVINSWLSNDYFIYRWETVQAGDTNGRDGIFQSLLTNFANNANILQMIFGYGAEGTMRIVGIHAHNDWLELLTDCGILGVIVYLVYFYSFFKDCRKYRAILPEVNILWSCLLILFIRSFFSMSFMDMYLGISSALGYSMAVCQQKKQLYRYEQ